MRIPVDWLNEYLTKPLSAKAMATALEASGIEVEAIEPGVKLDPAIVVGKIAVVKKHPNASKLMVAEVDVKKTTLTLVTGAPNVDVGAVGWNVAVATAGSKLPDGTQIKPVIMRGVESNGMLCSEQELGVGNSHAGILRLDDDFEIGAPISQYFKSTDVIDTTTAANRWDLNGIGWMALDVAAQNGQTSTLKTTEQLNDSGSPVVVKVEAPKAVNRYMLAHLKVDPTKASPAWMQRRLRAAGLRPINAVVDITNYVMLEYAQPLHAFDAAKVQLPVSVRQANNGEKLQTLDSGQHNLDTDDLVIADATGPIGFAGVMGGASSEVDANTTEIYLESASFNAAVVRKTAQRHRLRTDASSRFERGVPVDAAPLALGRAIQLLKELAGAEQQAGVADKVQVKPRQTVISASMERFKTVLGVEVSAKQAAAQLKKLGFNAATGAHADEITVEVPWWRPDVAHQDDLAEEVIELIGYDAVPATLPPWRPQNINFDATWSNAWKARQALIAAGLFEVMNYSFISEEQIEALGNDSADFLKLKNPLSVEQAYLRANLLPSLLRTVERNRRYASKFGAFEVSKVFEPTKPGSLPVEVVNLGVVVRRPNDGYRYAKGVLNRLARATGVEVVVKPRQSTGRVWHPTRYGTVMVDGKAVGIIGQIHPGLADKLKLGGEVGYFEVDWSQFAAASKPARYHDRGRFPSVVRDIAVVVDRVVTWQEVANALKHEEISFVSDYYGEDVGKGKKALALRLTVRFADRTPTDADADKAVVKVVEQLKKDFKATLR